MMKRVVAGLWLSLAGAALASAAELPTAVDLARDAHDAARTHAPILLFFTSAGCTYCEQVEQLYLKPMYERATYGSRLIIRRVPVDGASRIVNFAREPMAADAFARGEGVRITPVVRLYGADGRTLVPALVGYSSPDFYAGFLESRIAEAMSQMTPGR
jgi:thioredoxin-related protein